MRVLAVLCDPGTIGFIITAAVASAEVASTAVIGSITVAQIVGTVVLIAGAAALQYALQPEPPKPQDGQIITRQPLPSRRRGYGRLKSGGPLILSETINEKRYQVIALHQGEIDAIEQHWLSEFQVFFSGGNSGSILGGIYSLGGVPHVGLDTKLGTSSQTAYATLLIDMPALWTSAHRGLGVASALVMTDQPADQQDFTTVFPGGLPPPYRAVYRASKVWDPRDEGQDKDDPSTWTWSINPVLHALDYHRHADGMGLAAFDDVLFTAPALTEWGAAADICDETVGGVPRYQCSGSYLLPEDAPANVLGAILATCDGQLCQRSDGAIGIRVGKTIAPAVALDDRHILAYEGFTKGDNVFLGCNQVTAKYTSPDHDYQETDAQPWRNEGDITARGQLLSKPLPLQWVPNHSQARRLMKLAMRRFNPEWRGRIMTDLAGCAAMNERYLTLSIDELMIAAATFEVTSFELVIGSGALTCAIGVSSLDQSAFDWDEGSEAGTPPPVPAGVMGEAP